jgi:hypothetical protein
VVNVAGKTAGQQVFRVRTIPDPVATVGGYASATIWLQALLERKWCRRLHKDFPFELKYSVTAFTVTGETDDGDLIEATIQGNTWSSQAKTW